MVVDYENLRNSQIIQKEKQKKLMFKECLYITISAVQSFIKVLIYMNKTQSGC